MFGRVWLALEDIGENCKQAILDIKVLFSRVDISMSFSLLSRHIPPSRFSLINPDVGSFFIKIT